VANSIPSGIVIQYDNGGGTPVDITQYVLTLNDIDVESLVEEKHSFGDAWEESLPIGLARMAPVEISGLYDDTAASGPDALFAGRAPEVPGTATTRTLTITWRGSKTTSVETYLLLYKRSADRNNLTKYTARLQPTGAVTEA